jgi:nucleotide-binding universal stress UspA family protein
LARGAGGSHALAAAALAAAARDAARSARTRLLVRPFSFIADRSFKKRARRARTARATRCATVSVETPELETRRRRACKARAADETFAPAKRAAFACALAKPAPSRACRLLDRSRRAGPTFASEVVKESIMKRILVGLDGSPRSENVLTTAIDIARRFDAKLILCRAVGLPAEMPPHIWQDPVPLQQMLTDQATKYLEDRAQSVPKELLGGHRIVVEVGSPWSAVCAAANEERADCIVVGSHGYSGLDKVLGTTAAKIVNHARCSVIVVR